MKNFKRAIMMLLVVILSLITVPITSASTVNDDCVSFDNTISTFRSDDSFTTIEAYEISLNDESDSVPLNLIDGELYELEETDVGTDIQIPLTSIVDFEEKDQGKGRASFATAATNTFIVDLNGVFTHNLASANDTNIYLAPITQTCDVTGFVNSTSMDYSIGVFVYNLVNGQLIPESAKTSSLPHSWFSGQRARVTVNPGQYVGLQVISNSSSFVVNNTYQFGLITSSVGSRDPYEVNDTIYEVSYTGQISTSVQQYTNANFDSIADVDWYSFSFDGQQGYYPSIQLWGLSASNLVCLVFEETNGSLVHLSTYSGGYNQTASINSTKAKTYYLAVLSTSGSTGSYHLAQLKSRIPGTDRYQISVISAVGDQGLQSFSDGYKQTARYSLSGRFEVKDYYGNPVANFPVIVGFIETFYGYTYDASIVQTGSDGKGYFSLEIPEGTMARHHMVIGDTRYYYNAARLRIESYYDLNVNSITEDWYFYGGSEYAFSY